MKAHLISLAIALVATLSISTMSANTLPVEDILIGNTSESITVDWNNLTEQTVHVKIINANQEVVMEESVKNQTVYTKKYYVADLQNGQYNLVIVKKSSRITQPFSISHGKLSLSETEKKVKHFPVVTQKNNHFDISVFLGYNGTVSVNLLDESKNKVFTQTYDNVSMLHKRFSLGNIAEGLYKVEVMAGNETFYYSIMK